MTKHTLACMRSLGVFAFPQQTRIIPHTRVHRVYAWPEAAGENRKLPKLKRKQKEKQKQLNETTLEYIY